MHNTEVSGYWTTKKVCEYFGGIGSRTLNRWKNRETDPFPSPTHATRGSKSLYKAKEVVEWDLRQQQQNC